MKSAVFDITTHPHYNELKSELFKDLSPLASFTIALAKKNRPQFLTNEKYQTRLLEEIKALDYENNLDIILIHEEIIRTLKEYNVLNTNLARGNNAHSLTLFALGITQINPLDHDLNFDFFYDIENQTFRIVLEVPSLDHIREIKNILIAKYKGKNLHTQRFESISKLVKQTLTDHRVKKKTIDKITDKFRFANLTLKSKPQTQKIEFLQILNHNKDLLHFFDSNLLIKDLVMLKLDQPLDLITHPFYFYLPPKEGDLPSNLTEDDALFLQIYPYSIIGVNWYNIDLEKKIIPEDVDHKHIWSNASLTPFQIQAREQFKIKDYSLESFSKIIALARPATMRLEYKDLIINNELICFQDQAQNIIEQDLKISNFKALYLLKKAMKQNLDPREHELFENNPNLKQLLSLCPYLFSRSHAIYESYKAYLKVLNQ